MKVALFLIVLAFIWALELYATLADAFGLTDFWEGFHYALLFLCCRMTPISVQEFYFENIDLGTGTLCRSCKKKQDIKH